MTEAPSKIAPMVGVKLYRMGDQGVVVQKIQLALKSIGYPLTGTGFFGTNTDSAVEAFQDFAGLKRDGIVGKSTAAAIDSTKMVNGKLVMDGKEIASVHDTSIPLWLAVSLANLGLKEGAGAKNNPELVADIQTVARDYQNDATPWCAGWISFCLSKAGEKPSSQPLWALSYSDVRNQPVVRLAGPAVGAIAVKERKGGGHVTFVTGRTRGGALACCGGNQNDEVNVSPYAESVFLGFFWPKGAPLPVKTGMSNLPIVNTAGKPVSSEA